jgi:hypothetical protein
LTSKITLNDKSCPEIRYFYSCWIEILNFLKFIAIRLGQKFSAYKEAKQI